MKLDGLIKTLQEIQKDVNYHDTDVECSVDMSVEGKYDYNKTGGMYDSGKL